MLLEALVEQVAQRRDTEAEHVGDDVRLHELRRVSGQDYRNVHSCGPGPIHRDVERDAGTRGVLGPGGGDDQKAWHSNQYAQ